jgi:hypothetical protein
MEENGPIKSSLIKTLIFLFNFFINIKNQKLFLFNNNNKKINFLKIFAQTKYFLYKFRSLNFIVFSGFS